MDIVITVLFFTLGAITLGSALMVVVARSLGRSVAWLMSSLAAAAALVCLLEAPFVGIVQGVASLVATGSLLTLALRSAERDPTLAARQWLRGWWLAALGAVALFGGVLVPTFFVPGLPGGGSWPRTDFAAAPAETGAIGIGVAGIAAIGRSLMGEYLLPFEIAAMLLLLGVIGAIVLIRDEQLGDTPTHTMLTPRRRVRIYSVE